MAEPESTSFPGRTDCPPITPWLLHWFRAYSRSYLRRHFHAVRLARPGAPPIDEARPLVVYINHPAWWDPLVGCLLAERLFPARNHYAPIEAAALGRYRFMERLGLFGIDPSASRGAAQFLRTARAVLSHGQNALWITPQGRFADARQRPLAFRPGLAHLAARLSGATVLPLAFEYPFWEERTPEALARFGEPVVIESGRTCSVSAWNARFESHLAEAMDALALQAMDRAEEEFEVLLGGTAGVGGVYDLWRRFRAHLRGERFRPEHGAFRR